MDYRILGPIDVLTGGVALDLGPRKQRALLALLLINANRTVTTDRILEELWGDDAEGKENALWVYISRIRSALGADPSPLLTKDGGYALAVDPGSVDFLVFESMTSAARQNLKDDPEAAASSFADALAMWRGDALEDFRYDEFAQAEIHRLEELRQTAVEDRIEADLRLGGSGELVADLDALIVADPLAERPISLKMMALYRAGRQAEALRTFERFRRTLGEEMGIEPSPELVRLEEQILLHDSKLQTTMRSRAAPIDSEAAVNPFKGLQPFMESDADQFFGRDRLVADVTRRVAEQQLVTLVGPSGSGKSSVVRAGVIPALRKNAIPGSERWLFAQMVPGARPFAELEAALLRSRIDAPDSLAEQLSDGDAGILRAALRVLPEDTSKILIVIDQFEELFTLVDDEIERQRFLDGLTEAVNDPHGRIRALLTLRADFYHRPLQYPIFGSAMGDGVVNVVPMRPDELEHAAEDPAARAGVRLEPSLVAALLTDVVGQPGALPLFQYTLTELFDRRVERSLDLATYEGMGGLRGTLTRRADELFGGLSGSQQAAARQLFLRLVAIADTDEWSRRRVAASEIIALDVDVVDLKAVIDAYGSARLLTFDRDPLSGSPSVEVAHEALLTEWERLREWIDEARDDIQRQTRLAVAGAEWRGAGENTDYLLTGTRLDEYEAWAALTTLSLTTWERGYLAASVAEREAITAVEEERAAREAALGRRASRRLWGLAAAIAVMVGAVLFLAVSILLPEGPSVVLFVQGDDPFDEQMRIGFGKAVADFTVEDRIVEFGVDPVAELRAVSRTSPDLVIVNGFVHADVVEAVAPEFPDVHYALIDTLDEGPAMPNVTSGSIQPGGGSYLMGVAAALKTESDKVAMLSGGQLLPQQGSVAGFEAGVRDTDASVEVLVRFIGPVDDDRSGFARSSFDDPGPARVAANELIDAGADVIYIVLGTATPGVLEAASARSERVWVLGSDVDQFAAASVEDRAVLLSWQFERQDLQVYETIEALINGELRPGHAELDVTTGHVTYSVPGEAVSELVPGLDAAISEIVQGTIDVPERIDLVPGWWPTPNVTLDVTFDGEQCVIDGEPVIGQGDRVSVRYRNEADSPTGISVWVDDSGLTSDALSGPDYFFVLSGRAFNQSGWLVSPGGTTEIQGLATRDQFIVNCFNGLSGDIARILPVAPFTSQRAQAMVDGYFEAFNAGDEAGVMAVFTPDATVVGPYEDSDEQHPVSEMREDLAWDVAQGTQLTTPECSTTEGAQGARVIVICRYGVDWAVTQAVGAPPVGATTTMTVTPGGISAIHFEYGFPDHWSTSRPLHVWMQTNRPAEADFVGNYGTVDWTSIDGARRFGELTREYAELWAEYLDERGCTYEDRFC